MTGAIIWLAFAVCWTAIMVKVMQFLETVGR